MSTRIWSTRRQDSILELFENIFDHASFTGRSGTFFAYEGLGSIYWHMVSKLLLAVQETSLLRTRASRASLPRTVQALIDTYYDIRQRHWLQQDRRTSTGRSQPIRIHTHQRVREQSSQV